MTNILRVREISLAHKEKKMAEKTKKTAENIQNNISPEMGNLVEGETRSGLKFKVNAAVKDDTRVLYLLTRLQKNDLPIMDKSKTLFDLLELMFGSGEGFYAFQNEVAYRHNGVADTKSLIEEITDIFESVKLKN